MARKGSQQKNGVDHRSSNHKRKGPDSVSAVSDAKGREKTSEVKVFPQEELPNGNHPGSPLTEHVNKPHHEENENKHKPDLEKSIRTTDMHGIDAVVGLNQSNLSENSSGDCIKDVSSKEAPLEREETGTLPGGNLEPKHMRGFFSLFQSVLLMKNAVLNLQLSNNLIVRNLTTSALSALKTCSEWLERQRPFFISLRTNIYNARDHVKLKIEQIYPIVLKWLLHFGNIILLLLMVWLDCTLRGLDSFIRMGTTSFFSVIWCSIFSVFAMVGILKFLSVLAIAALTAVFIGFTLAILVVAIFGTLFLWFYGSFWTTLLVIFLGGLAFSLSHERLALFIATAYSVYCAWIYVGWLGLLLALNLSFISSDVLIYYLKNNVNQHGRSGGQPEQGSGMHGQPGFFNGESSFSENGPGLSTDRGPGVPSTSGVDTEITSEDEVVRLLNCTDHYSALGLSRFQNIDVNLLKREYRKKAMLVHPDKNKGDEKAAEAFKKLQNGYEVLLDSLKRKAYDEELRREELLNYFRRFQSASQKNGRHGLFASGFAQSEADDEGPFGESRRIACKNCGNFHVWVHTKKSKSRARWCQECKDFHQAKDGDGWVEQSSQPFLFGIFQKVDAPSAYVCADSQIYDATEWYICQGMRCPPNTHKPSFHVNTSVISKHSTGKGSSSGQRGGKMPTSNVEETMTEEEFFDWLQNAVQAGMFDNVSGSTSAENASSRSGNFKGSSSNSGGGSGNRRKKKGKKQW
ncbi:hypothetical protein SLE2022_164160 [Rubroshorea leprosula]